MMNNLKTRLRRSLVLACTRFQRRRHPRSGEVVVGSTGTLLWHNVLLLVPERRELVHQLAVFLEKLRRLNPGLNVDALVPERLAGLYRTDPLYNEIITIEAKSFSWLGFPSPALVRRLREKRYDLVVDFHQPLDVFIAYLAAQSEHAFRIGMKSSHSSYFYNVELVPQGGDYLDLVYKTTMVL